MTTRTKAKQQMKETLDKAKEGAQKLGSRVGQVLSETPEYISLRRNDRALRSEMDDHMRNIGKRIYMLHRKARGDSPFERFRTVTRELEILEGVEVEFRRNRQRLSKLKEDMRQKGA